jgi:hypothetical protein
MCLIQIRCAIGQAVNIVLNSSDAHDSIMTRNMMRAPKMCRAQFTCVISQAALSLSTIRACTILPWCVKQCVPNVCLIQFVCEMIVRPNTCPCTRVASRAAYIVVNHSDVHDPTMIRQILHPEIVLDSIRVRNAPCCFYHSQQF